MHVPVDEAGSDDHLAGINDPVCSHSFQIRNFAYPGYTLSLDEDRPVLNDSSQRVNGNQESGSLNLDTLVGHRLILLLDPGGSGSVEQP